MSEVITVITTSAALLSGVAVLSYSIIKSLLNHLAVRRLRSMARGNVRVQQGLLDAYADKVIEDEERKEIARQYKTLLKSAIMARPYRYNGGVSYDYSDEYELRKAHVVEYVVKGKTRNENSRLKKGNSGRNEIVKGFKLGLTRSAFSDLVASSAIELVSHAVTTNNEEFFVELAKAASVAERDKD